MSNISLNALERTQKKKKFKEAGFIPAVMYGADLETTMIKVEEKSLRKIISDHGNHARIDIKYGNKKRSGFIKDIQTLPIKNAILHVDFQMVSDTQELKMQVPIIFKGTDNLKRNQLIFQTGKHEIEVSGIMSAIPEDISIDVSELEYGHKIMCDSFQFDEGVTVLDDPETIYGTVIHMVKMEEETTESRGVDGAPTEEAMPTPEATKETAEE